MLSYVSLSETFSHHPLNTSSDFPSVWSRIWSSLSISVLVQRELEFSMF